MPFKGNRNTTDAIAQASLQLFVLRGDELLELCGSYESECSELFALRTQAGERTLRLQKQMSLNEWAAWQYKTLEVPSYA